MLTVVCTERIQYRKVTGPLTIPIAPLLIVQCSNRDSTLPNVAQARERALKRVRERAAIQRLLRHVRRAVLASRVPC